MNTNQTDPQDEDSTQRDIEEGSKDQRKQENDRIIKSIEYRLSSCTEEAFRKMFDLYPKGNPESAFQMLKYHVIKELTFNKNNVTIDLIASKWKEYLKKCSDEETDDKYVKSLESFIKSKDYNINFNPKLGQSFIDKYRPE